MKKMEENMIIFNEAFKKYEEGKISTKEINKLHRKLYPEKYKGEGILEKRILVLPFH